MTSLHNDVFEEIGISRIHDGTPAETIGRYGNRPALSPKKRRHTYAVSFGANKTIDTSGDRYTPLNAHSSQFGRTYSSHSLDDLPQRPGGTDDVDDENNKVIMTGWLYKTSRLKNSKTRSNRRRFRLTAHSLEYCHLLQTVLSYVAIAIQVACKPHKVIIGLFGWILKATELLTCFVIIISDVAIRN